jgi:ankyrin repeat protein
MTKELTALIERYRQTPEFMSSEALGVHSTGLTGDTLLHSAVITGNFSDVVLLINSGADVNAQGDLGYTPLHHAASRGSLEIAKKLIASGADVRLKNEFGQTPADVAMIKKQSKMVTLLRAK